MPFRLINVRATFNFMCFIVLVCVLYLEPNEDDPLFVIKMLYDGMFSTTGYHNGKCKYFDYVKWKEMSLLVLRKWG